MILAAPPDERLLERPQPANLGLKGRFAFVLLICFLLHAIPISLVAYGERPAGLAPGEQEIPVEMIVEPPPQEPEPAPPKNDSPPKQASLEEQFATDTPRAPNDEKVMKDARDEVSHAPKTATGAQPAPGAPPNGTAPSQENAANANPAETVELEQPAAPEPLKAEQAAPHPETPRKASQDPATAFASLPDYSFAPLSSYTPTTAGKAASTYVSIIYDKVLSRFRFPEGVAGRVQMMGEIDFSVDLTGRLLRQRVTKSSGSPEVDAAAMAAVRAAAPFPPSPTGTALTLLFHYGK